MKQNKCLIVLCDNSSTIKPSKNPIMHRRSKHIDIGFHFLRNFNKEGIVELIHRDTQDQLSYVMTKAPKLGSFVKVRNLLGMCCISDVN